MPARLAARRATTARRNILVVFFTTFDSRADAHRFARTVVEGGFAACVNIIPHVTSFYSWRGEMHEDVEILCLGKTTKGGFQKLKARLKSLHPYKLPELIALPVTDTHAPYAQWVRSVARPIIG